MLGPPPPAVSLPATSRPPERFDAVGRASHAAMVAVPGRDGRRSAKSRAISARKGHPWHRSWPARPWHARSYRLGMGTPAQSTGQHRSRLPTATACSRRWSPPRFQSTSVLAAAGWPWPFRLRCWETGYFARPFQQLIQAGLDHRDPCCRHGVSPLQLAGRQHRAPGPRSSVRGKARPAVRALDARSDVRPMLNHGGADTGTLSGTHAGLSAPRPGKLKA